MKMNFKLQIGNASVQIVKKWNFNKPHDFTIDNPQRIHRLIGVQP